MSDLDEQGRILFEQLRTLRMEIAREEKVPPYIVFNDKTLTQMAMIRPIDEAQMMTVSGVCEFKYAKYGQRFLQCILNMQPLEL